MCTEGLNLCFKIARRSDGKKEDVLALFFPILFKQFAVCSSLHSKVAFEAFKACFQKVGKLNLVTQDSCTVLTNGVKVAV